MGIKAKLAITIGLPSAGMALVLATPRMYENQGLALLVGVLLMGVGLGVALWVPASE